MDIFGIGETGSMVALALAGLLLVVSGTMVSSWSRRRRLSRSDVPSGRAARRAAKRRGIEVVAGPGAITSDEVPRIAALERAQAEMTARIAEVAAARSAPEEQLKATASQMLGLIRDKNATLETALAGLDQLRARVKTLEQIGDVAEARGLLEGIEEKLAGARESDTEARAAFEARLRSLETSDANPVGEITEQLAKLHEQKDAVMAGLAERLGPMENRLAGLEATAPAEAATLTRLETEIAALRDKAETAAGETGEARAELRAALAEAGAMRATLDALDADRANLSDTLTARIDAVARDLAERDPEAELAGLAGRLDGLKDLLETRTADAATHVAETLATRLAPVEARLGDMEAALTAADPAALLDGFAARLDALQGRMDTFEAPGDSPFGEIADQLTRLYAQKDATVETVFARLAPLEAKLVDMEAALDGADPAAALAALETRLGDMEETLTSADPEAALSALETRLEASFGGRIDGLDATQAAQEAAFNGALSALSDDLGGRLERLSEVSEAARAGLADRMAALEAGLEARDPTALLEGFAERVAALHRRLEVLEEPGESPFAEIADQLTRLYAQKDATVETVFARLVPLETRLAEIETDLTTRAPKPAFDALSARMEAFDGLAPRLEALETRTTDLPDRATLEETVSETVAAASAALTEDIAAANAALEDKVTATSAGLAGRMDALDWAQDATADRLVALSEAQKVDRKASLKAAEETVAREARKAAEEAVTPLADIAGQMSDLFSRKEAAVEAVLARLAPVEARLADLEARPWDPEADEVRAQVQTIAAQMIAARTAAEQTELFADRLTRLEDSLPRLSAAQSLLMQGATPPPADATPVPGRARARRRSKAAPETNAFGEPDPDRVLDDGAVGGMDEVWAMPRLVSLHHK